MFTDLCQGQQSTRHSYGVQICSDFTCLDIFPKQGLHNRAARFIVIKSRSRFTPLCDLISKWRFLKNKTKKKQNGSVSVVWKYFGFKQDDESALEWCNSKASALSQRDHESRSWHTKAKLACAVTMDAMNRKGADVWKFQVKVKGCVIGHEELFLFFLFCCFGLAPVSSRMTPPTSAGHKCRLNDLTSMKVIAFKFTRY